jgi:hypothetical protein
MQALRITFFMTISSRCSAKLRCGDVIHTVSGRSDAIDAVNDLVGGVDVLVGR